MKSSFKEIALQKWVSILSVDDLMLLSNALNEILNGPNAIDDWEFQTRVGVEKDEAEKLLKSIGVLFDEINENVN